MFGRLLLKIQTHINSKHEDFMEANKILSLDLNPADANPHSQTHNQLLNDITEARLANCTHTDLLPLPSIRCLHEPYMS